MARRKQLMVYYVKYYTELQEQILNAKREFGNNTQIEITEHSDFWLITVWRL